MNQLKENQWSFKSTSSIDKKFEDSTSTSRSASLNLTMTEDEAKSKFVKNYEVLQFNLIIILKKTIIFCSLSLGGKRSFFDTKSVWTFLYTFSEVHFIIFIFCRLQKSVWVWTCQKWWSKEKFGKTRNNQWRSNNRQRNRREGWMGQQMQFFLVCVGICRYVSINNLNL